MKVCCLTLCPFLFFSFISHMVQMKDIGGALMWPIGFSLYIPHGSDERFKSDKRKRTDIPLYPTWFRWKRKRCGGENQCHMLYIPHGSDESGIKRISVSSKSSFISHMVQMKVEMYAGFRPTPTSLYPTWFRWKITSVVDMRPLVGTLYPTWFRWKATPDEIFIGRKGFISHMVQMKAYCFCMSTACHLTFISHMVQMKESVHYESTTTDILYIPHGSDERETCQNLQASCRSDFISHMVQMKG